jgi:hypothetical protein
MRLSMDGRGRVFDNIFVERLWRTVKYEEVYLKDFADVQEAWANLERYFRFYNEERLHQALGYRTPGASPELRRISRRCRERLMSGGAVWTRRGPEPVFAFRRRLGPVARGLHRRRTRRAAQSSRSA